MGFLGKKVLDEDQAIADEILGPDRSPGHENKDMRDLGAKRTDPCILEGVFLVCGLPTENRRLYPRDVVFRALERYTQRIERSPGAYRTGYIEAYSAGTLISRRVAGWVFSKVERRDLLHPRRGEVG